MDKIRIRGGNPLNGVVPIAGAKNAALPLLTASLLTDDTLTLSNLPGVADIKTMFQLLQHLGVSAQPLQNGAGQVSLSAASVNDTTAPYAVVVAGNGNEATGQASAVVGGQLNEAAGASSVVLSGKSNVSSGSTSAIVAGWLNRTGAQHAAVLGGYDNDGVNAFALHPQDLSATQQKRLLPQRVLHILVHNLPHHAHYAAHDLGSLMSLPAFHRSSNNRKDGQVTSFQNTFIDLD